MTVAQTSNVEHHNLQFVRLAFETILSRSPTEQETTACLQFLQDLPTQLQQSDLPVFPAGTGTAQRSPAADPLQRARENLLLVLFSHNDFVTIR